VDKWLWAARFFKTRALAAQAIGGGKVEVNGEKVKRAKTVRPGDVVCLRRGPYLWELVIRSLNSRRGGAAEAATLYAEDPASRERRLALAEQHRLARQSFSYGEGKPSKKERRALSRLKGNE
jgi:ribosome-associated heat shock protein Hsp15